MLVKIKILKNKAYRYCTLALLVFVIIIVGYIKLYDSGAPYKIGYKKVFGSGGGDFSPYYILTPMAKIKFNSGGHLLIMDYFNHSYSIAEYSNDLKYIKTIGRTGQGPGELMYPSSFCLDNRDDIYVTDLKMARITIYRKDGVLKRMFRIKQPYNVTSIAVDSKKNIYLSNPMDDSLVTVYDTLGCVVKKFGQFTYHSTDHGNAIFNGTEMTIDENDNLWLVFTSKPILRKYNSQNVFLFEKELVTPKISKQKAKAPPFQSDKYLTITYLTDIQYGQKKIYVSNHQYIVEINTLTDNVQNVFMLNDDKNLTQDAYLSNKLAHDPIKNRLLFVSGYKEYNLYQAELK